MGPQVRRRGPPSNACTLLILIWLVTSVVAQSAVLGVDLGTEYIKAALVKPGIPLDIVLTKDSKRKESSAVAFKPSSKTPKPGEFPERLYGGDALALQARRPDDVYPNLKTLLGIPASENVTISAYKSHFPALAITKHIPRDTVAFQSPSFPSTDPPFSVEELLAMSLANVRENAESMAGLGVLMGDVVITVPSFYTAEERRAVILAAELSGMNVLGLISDGLAVGLNYATGRTFPSVSDGEKPEHHVVYDVGAGSASASVLKFQARSIKDVGRFNKTIQEVLVVGTGWDRSLGGDALNQIIVEDIMHKFIGSDAAKSAGVSKDAVSSNGRALAKLWKEAERIRQVLSANAETSASFESLYQDVDFRYKLSRDDFEKLSAGYASRVEGPIKRALESASLDVAEVDSIILHGGVVRTPFVQKRLEKLAGGAAKLRSNVNADEAAVLGAAFKGAGLSPSFKVKEIRDVEIGTHAAGIKWVDQGKERKQRLFLQTSAVGAAKEVTFKTLDDFSMTIFQEVSAEHSNSAIENEIASMKTSNLTVSVAKLVNEFGCARPNITTKFTLRLDPVTSLPEVVKGSVSCEVDEVDKKGGVMDDVKGIFGFGPKKGEQEVLKDNRSEKESVSTEISQTPTPTAAGDSTSSSPSERAKSVPKKRIQSNEIAFETTAAGVPRLSETELRQMRQRLASFALSDRSRRIRDAVLNNLESFTYRVRDLLIDDSFVAVSSKVQRGEIEEVLKSTSDWLYAEGSGADMGSLQNKLQALESVVDPVTTRRDEAAKRPEFIKSLQEVLDQTQGFIYRIEEHLKGANTTSSAETASVSTESDKQASATISSSGDGLDALEESITATPAASTTSSKLPPQYQYTEEDLTKLSSTHQSVKDWLTKMLAEQDKLQPFEEPLLRTSDIEAKARQLSDVTVNLLQRGFNTPKPKKTKPKPTKAAKGKSTSSDSRAGSSSTSDGSATGSRALVEEPGTQTSSEISAESPSPESIREGEDVSDEEEVLDLIKRRKGKKEHDEL